MMMDRLSYFELVAVFSWCLKFHLQNTRGSLPALEPVPRLSSLRKEYQRTLRCHCSKTVVLMKPQELQHREKLTPQSFVSLLLGLSPVVVAHV